jgi:hypothetical protein
MQLVRLTRPLFLALRSIIGVAGSKIFWIGALFLVAAIFEKKI